MDQVGMKTTFAKANESFRAGRYEEAKALYQQAISEKPELERLVRFNLGLVEWRIGQAHGDNRAWNDDSGARGAGTGVLVVQDTNDEVTTEVTLERPENLDPWFFERICESGLFDPEWYIENYADQYGIEGDPLGHYLEHGVELRLNPSPGFDTEYYLESNPDVAAADIHPFLHYVCNGREEGRRAKPQPDAEYSERYPVSDAAYVPRLAPDMPPPQAAVKVIAFYLPQFHPIPENNAWWGEGFTEWTNVKPAQPMFEGHYQPHVPDDYLGYYNLLDLETMHKQVELAKLYGIGGFCFYAYWFSGKRLLEKPLEKYLNDLSLDLPFCVCWANENWTRRWDGDDKEILIAQQHSAEDDIALISEFSRYFRDRRYIRIDGRPLFLVYRPSLLPSIKETVERWRQWCRVNDIGEIYLAYTQSFESMDPAEYGFDAAIEFPPNNSSPPFIKKSVAPIVSNFEAKV